MKSWIGPNRVINRLHSKVQDVHVAFVNGAIQPLESGVKLTQTDADQGMTEGSHVGLLRG